MLSISTPEIPIACNPHALNAEQQERWMLIGPQLYGAIQEIQELPNGYAFRLPNDTDMLMLAAEDINYERLCCPFVRYELEIEPNNGSLWFRWTGGDGVKEFLRIAFEEANLIPEDVARAAGFSVANRTEIDSIGTTLEAVDRLNERYASLQSPTD